MFSIIFPCFVTIPYITNLQNIFRLAMLCGKYESNAIALRVALGITDRAIEAYDVLLALLETELSLSESNPGKRLNLL